MSSRIKIGISACLLGHNVRYDGGHRLAPCLNETFGVSVEWIPLCPETECGLGVPREPMRLIDDAGLIRLVTIDSRLDRTTVFSQWLERKLVELAASDIRGYVLKARSPSCGVRDTPVFDAAGNETRKGAGLFTAALLMKCRRLPVEDECSIQELRTRDRFIELVLGGQLRKRAAGKHFV
jgi:uncharacterized protein YbbK (DUF523 family)